MDVHVTLRAALLSLLVISASGATGCDRFLGGKPKPTPTATTPEPDVARGFLSRSAPASEVVARVNDKIITKRELELTLKGMKAAADAAKKPWKPLSTERTADKGKKEGTSLYDVIDEMVREEVLAQDAVAKHTDFQTDTKARFWNLYRTFLYQEWAAAQSDQVTVTDADAEQFYKDNPRFFAEPERMRVLELVVDSEEKAKNAMKRLIDGESFTSVAREMSLRPELAQEAAGQRWVMASAVKAIVAPNDDAIRALDPSLEASAFAIDRDGGFSNYVKGLDSNYHIVQRLELKKAGIKPMDHKLRETIHNYLRIKKIDDTVNALKNKANIQIPEHLPEIEQPAAME